MAATLTKSVLSDVMTGIASIKLAPVGKITTTTFDATDEIFTIRDSVNVSQTTPTKNEIKIDQAETAIAVTYESGEFTITGQIPSAAKPLLDYFYETTTTAPVAITDHDTGVGVKLTQKTVRAMMYIKAQSGPALVITNAEFVTNIMWDSTSTNPLRLEFTATALTAVGGENGEEAEVIFYPKKKVTA